MIRRVLRFVAFVAYIGYGQAIVDQYDQDVRDGRVNQAIGTVGDHMLLRLLWPVFYAIGRTASRIEDVRTAVRDVRRAAGEVA
jgi:hypothetical protein